MLIIYAACSIAITLFGIKIMARLINPITIINVPWLVMLLLYETKFVSFDPLSDYTYFIIFIFLLLYDFAVLLGYWLNCDLVMFNIKDQVVSKRQYQRMFRLFIILSAGVAAVSFLTAMIQIISYYGLGFYKQIASIYSNRVTGEVNITSVNYVGSFIYVSTILTGLYMGKFGFEKILLFPILLIVSAPFVSGTKEVITECGILFFLSYYDSLKAKKESRILNIVGRKPKRKARKKKLLVILAICFVLFVLVFITNQRGAYVNYSSEKLSLMSPLFQKIVFVFPAAYTIYTYFSGPMGVLNAFLASPEYSFGRNTLLPVYSILAKLGFDIEVVRYQKFYNIPYSTNVGTALREVIEDYTEVGAFVFVFIVALVIGFICRHNKRKHSVTSMFIYALVMMAAAMSFFVWSFRSTGLIIALVCGAVMTKYLDRYRYLDEELLLGTL